MPKNKKKWIDKKNAETVSFSGVYEPTVGKHKKTVVDKETIEERQKYGIYYNDDYDYMKHLRTVNELSVLGAEERTIVRAPKGENFSTSTFLETGVAGTVQEGGTEISIVPEKEGAIYPPRLDAEMVAALEGAEDYEEELEEDFVATLNGGELPSNKPPQPLAQMSMCEIYRKNNDSDDSDRLSTLSDEFSQSEDEDMKGQDWESRVERHVEKQFERLYDGDTTDEEEEEEPDNMIEPDSHRMKQLVEESKNDSVNLVLSKDEVALRYAYSNEADDEANARERVLVECPTKKQKWDCESVLSSYSNIYNHPAVIKESNKKRARKQKTSADQDIAEEQCDQAMDCEMSDLTAGIDSVPGTGRRPRDETTEEKRERKKAVKEARAERRVEKKANKKAFAETKKTESLISASNPSVKHVHIA